MITDTAESEGTQTLRPDWRARDIRVRSSKKTRVLQDPKPLVEAQGTPRSSRYSLDPSSMYSTWWRLRVQDIPAKLRHECGFQEQVDEAVTLTLPPS